MQDITEAFKDKTLVITGGSRHVLNVTMQTLVQIWSKHY